MIDVLGIGIVVLPFMLAKGSRQQLAVEIAKEMEDEKDEEPAGWLRRSCTADEDPPPTIHEKRIAMHIRRTPAS